MKLILLGAPGAGKGTQAELICGALRIPAVSTGNLIREAIGAGTEAGLQAKTYVDAGNLVPDGIVVAMLRERLSAADCGNGYVLDGFPRTLKQAETLEEMGIEIDRVVEIDVPDGAIERRLSGRWVCESCGASFHIEHKPSATGERCDHCGAGLAQREDDAPETVRARLRVYHEQTEPLREYYRRAGKLVAVDGRQSVEQVGAAILAGLEALRI